MDLNVLPPATWETIEDGPYELARHHLASKSSVLILLNAWLDSGKDPEEEVDANTINYWAMRLRPLWSEEEVVSEKGTETMVVVCNRTGEENGSSLSFLGHTIAAVETTCRHQICGNILTVQDEARFRKTSTSRLYEQTRGRCALVDSLAKNWKAVLDTTFIAFRQSKPGA
jgi:hypothetical protein